MNKKKMWQHCQDPLGQGLFDNDMWIMSILFAFRVANEQVTLQWLTPPVAKQHDMLPAPSPFDSLQLTHGAYSMEPVHSVLCLCSIPISKNASWDVFSLFGNSPRVFRPSIDVVIR